MTTTTTQDRPVETRQAEQFGAVRCAARLAEATGLPVTDEDIKILAELELLRPAGWYKDWPMYDVADVDALAGTDTLAAVVAGRREWIAASVDTADACERLRWRYDELAAEAAAFGVTAGRLGRYALADVERLAADPDFQARRLLGPEQAARHFDVRRVDFDHAVAAGWVSPDRYVRMPVGRRSTVTVALYRQGDVADLAGIPGVDWHAVREVAPGRASVLREFVRRPPSRAQVIRRVAADLGAGFRREVWAYHRPGIGWALDWETIDGRPTRDEVAAAIAADPVARRYRDQLTLATDAGAAVNWARAMLEPGAAVILDTETTDLHGAIVEIAVVDAATGKVLLDTLVNPGLPIEPGAQAIHGISDADVVDAPTWDKVLPRLKRVTRGRQILAYNADYDAGVVAADTARAGLKLGPLAADDRWGCVMVRRSDWERVRWWLPLGGGHRACGDALAARDVLLQMTAPGGVAARRRRR
nr:3'-5' exonuclease [Micromonospora sp. DSM 115978]